MRYHFANLLPLLLGIALCCLGFGCSNSEYTEGTGWEEYAYEINENETDGVIDPERQGCFNNYRLPNLQSAFCKKKFYTQDTVTDFPESGFFQKTFTIAFPNNKPLNCEIGGKVPTTGSPRISTISIDSSTTIRCADLSNSASTKAEIIRTYILEKAPDIAAVFITTDPNLLFNPDTGIYMEGPNAKEAFPHYGANYWLDKEIPIFVELVESNETRPAFAKHAGLKICGNWSRANAKKSVAITFREKYGDKRLYYRLFPEFPELSVFKGFILRNNGNNFDADYIRDRLASSLSEGLGVDYQRGRYSIIYYNGKYFGIHDLRERSNEYYFETHYGISHNNINLLKANNTVSAGTSKDYIDLINWIEQHNLDNKGNYNYISSKIDIDNFINYMQIEMFANNWDWLGNNLKKWNCANPQTPWKWFLYDLDLSFGHTNKNVPQNIFDYVLSETSVIWQNSPNYTFLIRALLKNNDFKKSFINRMTTLTQMNFESTRVLSQIDKMMAEIKNEIPRDQNHWELSASKMNNHLGKIKRFAQNRPSIIVQHLQEHFQLEEPFSVTLSINGKGNILVHNLPLDKTSLTIPFFKNFPVTLSAVPQNGRTWVSWSDGDTNSNRTIVPGKIAELTAIFK